VTSQDIERNTTDKLTQCPTSHIILHLTDKVGVSSTKYWVNPSGVEGRGQGNTGTFMCLCYKSLILHITILKLRKQFPGIGLNRIKGSK
jgi:hypothetical protein